MTGDLAPSEGQIRRHLHLAIAKYNQHSNDQLDPTKTPLEFMMSTYVEKKMEETEWRQHVGRYGISGKMQTQPIGHLSDGLKSRVVFAMLSIERPNLLLLDEPTNHLDMECIDSLAEAVKRFDGGLVLVSHDFRLLDQVAKEIWVCDEKTITVWKGDIRSYKNHLIRRMKENEARTDKLMEQMMKK